MDVDVHNYMSRYSIYTSCVRQNSGKDNLPSERRLGSGELKTSQRTNSVIPTYLGRYGRIKLTKQSRRK